MMMHLFDKLFGKVKLFVGKLWSSRKQGFISYKNEKYFFSFKIPRNWEKSRMSVRPNSVVNYCSIIDDSSCYVYAEEKSNYRMIAALQDFATIELSIFKQYEGFNLKSMQLMERSAGNFLLYEISFVYMKKLYAGYLSFHESEKTFYELGILVSGEEKENNDYDTIINSFEVLSKV